VAVALAVIVFVPVLEAEMEAVGDTDGDVEADGDTEAVAEGGTYGIAVSFMISAPVPESASVFVICG